MCFCFMAELNLEQRSGEKFFGDLILYETNTIVATALGWFTGSVFNHCAIRVLEGKAEAPDFIEWVKRKDFLKHNLKEPENYVISYQVLRHRELNEEKRAQMKKFYELKFGKGYVYDLPKIYRLAKMHISRRKQEINDITTNPDKNTIDHYFKLLVDSFGGKKEIDGNDMPLELEEHLKIQECPSIYALALNSIELHHGVEGIHASQIEPYQFSPQFGNSKHEIVDEIKIHGKRHKIWARHNVSKKLSGIRSASGNAGIKTIKMFSSFFNHKP